MGRAFLAPIMLALAICQGGAAVWAQQALVERAGSAEVPVYEDNLDAAKGRAVLGAQHDAISRALRDLVAEEWLTLFDGEVRRRILSRPQRYIASYRLEKLAASLDRTRYSAFLTAQVNQGQLAEDLRGLSLPLKGDTVYPLLLLYGAGDQALSDPALVRGVVDGLKERLRLLNFALERSKGLGPGPADLFENPLGDAAARGEVLRREGVAAGLFLAYEPPEGPGGAPGLRARLFQAGNGVQLGNFAILAKPSAGALPAGASRFRQAFLSRLVQPLAARMQPGGVTPPGRATGEARPLSLRVIGFESVEGQESFERAFFRPETGFGDFALYRLQEKTVTYRGNYSGDRRLLEQTLPGKAFSVFRIEKVYWFNDVLELDVERAGEPPRAEMRLFSPNTRPPGLEDSYRLFRDEFPDLEVGEPTYGEVEDNGWLRRANPVPLEQVVYGYVDSRGDSDFFVAEELPQGTELVIGWYRMGRTNLNPSVRVYDETGEPVKQYVPRNYVEVSYEIPRGQHSVAIEVGDRYRGLKGDTGGYLNYHYLLWVRHKPSR